MKIKVEYTKGEVAAMFGVTRQCVGQWIARGELRAYRKGQRWAVPLTALRDNIDRWESLLLKRQLTRRDDNEK